MSYIENDIARIPVDVEIPNLQHFYNFGRNLPTNNLRPKEAVPFRSIPMDAEKAANLAAFAKSLLSTVGSDESVFVPFLIELSVYDPADPAGRVFFSIFIAKNDEIIRSYIHQMDVNLASAKEYEKHQIAQDRGPIIPSERLHDSAYYSKAYTDEKSNFSFETLENRELCIYFGGFENPDLRDPRKDKKDLDNHVGNFFDQTIVEWKEISNTGDFGQGYTFNYALLLPLFRPSGLSSGQGKIRHNGGGIFVYGELKNKTDEAKFVVQLQTQLTRSIFNISHANVAHDAIESFRSTSTVMLVHQIKNKLTNKIARKLAFIDREFPHIDPEAKQQINETVDSTQKIIKKFTTFLNNVQQEFAFIKGGPDLTYRNFKFLISSLKEERIKDKELNIPVEVVDNPEVDEIIVKIHFDVLQMISEEFLENAAEYYIVKEIPVEKQKVEFIWMLSDRTNFIKMQMKSRNTKFPEKNLASYGKFPITDTRSTGLGGFLTNEILKMGDAYKYRDGRHWLPMNIDNDFIIEIQFPIA